MQFGIYIKEEAIHYHPPKKLTKPQQARVKKSKAALQRQISYSEGYRKTNHSEAGSSSFLKTMEWKRLRMEALKKYGPKCQCCGATTAMGAVMNVDHIKPRKFYPELALDINNLQILCGSCNMGKSNWDMTDWRPSIELDKDQSEHIRSILKG